mmetsp:Transcript_19885/g.48329  ORF Transcript_19885/g.48329 Transcript_19885/m.48329 type:complete len:88 (-) Transcript_19885:91-354(-)
MVQFDPEKTSFEQMLNVFWANVSVRGSAKTQYKSAIWYHDDEQKAIIDRSMADQQKKKGAFKMDVLPACQWWDAEGYHQKYYAKRRR